MNKQSAVLRAYKASGEIDIEIKWDVDKPEAQTFYHYVSDMWVLMIKHATGVRTFVAAPPGGRIEIG